MKDSIIRKNHMIRACFKMFQPEVYAYLFKVKESENFNRRNTLSISRIALKLHCVPKFEPDAEIGQISADFEMGRFEIGSKE